MTNLITQATIADDRDFQARVRQAAINLALTVRQSQRPVDDTEVPHWEASRALALSVLYSSDTWARQVARGLATLLRDTEVQDHTDITDASIEQSLSAVFSAYIEEQAT